MIDTPSSSLSDRSVLIVEDNDIYRQVVCAALQRRYPDWEILGAASLAQASAIIGSRELHVVVTDLSLPDGSGLDLLPRLAPEMARGLKLVALTNDSPRDVLPGLKLRGYQGFVAKEHGIKALCEAVEAVLEGKQFESKDSE
jgi:DNA-binding NarL/FixJ family response regulator